MRNLLRSLLCIAVLGTAGSWAAAGEPNPQRVVDNVVFELSSTPEGLTACLNTVRGAKLSGPYGVAVTAASDDVFDAQRLRCKSITASSAA